MGMNANHDTIKFACYFHRANAYFKLKKFKEALSDLKEAQGLKENTSDTLRPHQPRTYSILRIKKSNQR
jgi:hypothetical protein